MKQDIFTFGEPEPAAPEVVLPAYDWDFYDPWPLGLSHQAYLILQIRRDLRARDEVQEEWQREFFEGRIVQYRDTYNANKAAEPRGPSPRDPA